MAAQTRRERERELRRSQILDAAREILFAEGMSAVSMNKIAARAELSVGTLYLYFQNKEELFAALQEEGLDQLYEMIKQARDQADKPQEKLYAMALAYLDFSEQYRKYFDIMNYFLTSPEVMFPPELKQRIDHHGDRIITLLEEVLGDGDHARSKHKCRRDALVFWSTLHGMLQLRKLRGTILADDDVRELYRHGLSRLIGSLLPQ